VVLRRRPPPHELEDRLLAAIQAGTKAVVPEPQPRAPRRRAGVARRAAVLAGAVLLVLALASTAALSVALDHERQLKDRFAGLLDQRELVLEVVDGRETERAFLRSQDERLTAYGKLFTNPEHREAVVLTGRMPKPPAGRQYDLWVTSGGRTRRAGTLKVNEKGFGLLVFTAPQPGPPYDSARVVLERAGSRAPSGTTILAWTREG
jgi:hypothetical protein